MRVGFQGETGAYSEQAAHKHFDTPVTTHPFPSFKSVFRALSAHEIDAAVLPIENSLAGSVHENYDLMLEFRHSIVAETVLRISHNLMVLPGTRREHIKRVISHPQALGQCRHYLEDWQGIEIQASYDTAGSAKMVRERGLKDTAAIASEQAAGVYGLDIIAEAIESNHQNFTRFLILQTDAHAPESGGKTSIAFATKDIPGALFKSLAVFALRDINLLKIESRPLHGSPFRSNFYVDFQGSVREQAQANALKHLEEITDVLHVLGSYPADPMTTANLPKN